MQLNLPKRYSDLGDNSGKKERTRIKVKKKGKISYKDNLFRVRIK